MAAIDMGNLGHLLDEQVKVSIADTLGYVCLFCSHTTYADGAASHPRRFLVPVESTLKALLAREDTDNNMQITIDDKGPKVLFSLFPISAVS